MLFLRDIALSQILDYFIIYLILNFAFNTFILLMDKI